MKNAGINLVIYSQARGEIPPKVLSDHTITGICHYDSDNDTQA